MNYQYYLTKTNNTNKDIMKRNDLLNTIGEFIMDIGRDEYYVITKFGFFIWSEGVNHLYKTELTYDEWRNDCMGTDKGKHLIRDYCGKNVQITLE